MRGVAPPPGGPESLVRFRRDDLLEEPRVPSVRSGRYPGPLNEAKRSFRHATRPVTGERIFLVTEKKAPGGRKESSDRIERGSGASLLVRRRVYSE